MLLRKYHFRGGFTEKREPTHISEENTTGYRLYKAMKDSGYSIHKLASETDISEVTIQRLLRTDKTGHVFTWSLIARTLGVSIDWIFYGED